MRELVFLLSFVLMLLGACSAESIIGPEDTGAVLETAEECGLDPKPC